MFSIGKYINSIYTCARSNYACQIINNSISNFIISPANIASDETTEMSQISMMSNIMGGLVDLVARLIELIKKMKKKNNK